MHEATVTSYRCFSLDHTDDERVLSFRNQINRLTTSPRHPSAQAGWDEWTHTTLYPSVPDELPDLHQFLLDDRARLTDVLRAVMLGSHIGFLVSERLAGLLGGFAVAGRFLPATLHAQANRTMREKTAPVVLVELPQALDDVDLAASTFAAAGAVVATADVHALRDAVRAHGPALRPVRLALGRRLDLFRVPGTSGILCSEALRDAMSAAEVTGLAFGDDALEVWHR
jgi:hypothetical protein